MEIDAIIGAKELIKKYKPTIVFCLYYKKEDIYEIPLLLHKINPEYRFYMRHYSELPVETILYAVTR